tara:strand:+ start:477 stop:755 length:279 start_codon:yes stop_codon:yes gene_type:complete
MSDGETVEVEVSDAVTPQDAIRNMMDKWADGDLTGANDEFFAMMNKRADDMLAVRKADVVPQIFNDPEMQAMGLEDAPEAEEPEDEATNEDV